MCYSVRNSWLKRLPRIASAARPLAASRRHVCCEAERSSWLKLYLQMFCDSSPTLRFEFTVLCFMLNVHQTYGHCVSSKTNWLDHACNKDEIKLEERVKRVLIPRPLSDNTLSASAPGGRHRYSMRSLIHEVWSYWPRNISEAEGRPWKYKCTNPLQ